ncbi:hypothetical protein F4813DRAFT_388963 [Daldinia decipiens]|uniref:uncharacterized protein n=1 Tax=Daldinia decipiens TaxID=326647 RepID=UPI0020C48D12|nr:uncharacterized protein F4813DRAFT_388963 [Daldinia decipiens]KAI1658179.1 hypothetical protein F4813DRAFT_388963 [Daldinia decipiens]
MAIRLIDTRTLCLVSIPREDTPRYAILSHTWDNDNEISFQEMMAINDDPHHPATDKTGYLKIVGTCQMAKNHGIPYAWVDNCCIDKTSSSDLGEAINSMYRWYQEAEVCYALLSDFDTDDTLEIALPKCRWFTRGWCLQGLIAPKTLLFLDSQWNRIGSKADLTSLVSKITLVDEEILIDRDLVSSVPVARRMSWAAKRMTTREEDIAYCLLGIFDVNMPILYGEGPKAFQRLQEEIIKASNDLSIFAFDESPSRNVAYFDSKTHLYCSLFATSPRDFEGCGNLEYTRNDVHWNNAFALTNKGLHFRRAEMQIDFRHGLYNMPLNCKPLGGKLALMHLRKVGTGLYARCNADADWYNDEESFTEIENDVYIIRTITPSVRLQLEEAEKYAIRVQSRTHNLLGGLQVILRSITSDRWDASRSLFLTRGDKSFGGFWKVFPSLARKIQKSEGPQPLPSGHFYLVCRLHYPSEYPSPRAWIRLYAYEEWAKEWADLGNKFTKLANIETLSTENTENTAAELVFGTGSSRLLVTATIQLKMNMGCPYFELELNMTENPQ